MGRARSVAVASCIMVRQMDVKDRIVQADADTLRYLDEANEQEQRGHALVLEAQALRAKALHEQARPSVHTQCTVCAWADMFDGAQLHPRSATPIQAGCRCKD